MLLPPGHTEFEVLEVIERVVASLSKNMAFGPFESEDIAQQGRLEALKVLAKGLVGYDPSRPLANFLYTHVKRRLHNFYRDNCRRNDPPCLSCHDCHERQCLPTEHDDGQICKRYREWRLRNDRKMTLMGVSDREDVVESKSVSSSGEFDVDLKEILQGIDQRLPVELRLDYLRMRAGETVPKAQRLLVEEAVSSILRELDVI